MATMTHRTTFSLDEQTMRRLKTLAQRWNVSQAEVVRRAVEGAEGLPYENPSLAALEALKRYHRETGGLDHEVAEAYLNEVYENRKDWGR